MTFTITIPFWGLLIGIFLVGFIGLMVCMKLAEKNGSYFPDIYAFFTGIGIFAVAVVLDIGLILGKYVF